MKTGSTVSSTSAMAAWSRDDHNAPQGITELEEWGMPFARESDGRISQRFFGAHTYRRTSCAGDYTTLEIQRTLLSRAAELAVPILDAI